MDAGMDFAGICSSLAAGGYSVVLRGFSALDRYLGLPALPFLWIETNADIAILARFVENLRFPGVEVADGAVDIPNGIYPNGTSSNETRFNGTCYFRCLDSLDRGEWKETDVSFPLLSFGYDWQTRCFQDPLGVYPLARNLLQKNRQELRDKRSPPAQGEDFSAPSWENLIAINEASLEAGGSSIGWYRMIMDGALLLARYDLGSEVSHVSAVFTRASGNCPSGPLPGPELQRVFLSCLMVSSRPDRGLEFLKRSGFLDQLWPELGCYDKVDHSKEFHPEGNVWNHTLETFRHRKPGGNGAFDLCLSLGLLLHDVGKPISAANGNHRFDGHAELGARAAARFLERLEFEPALIQDIFYLVKNHMLPAALKRLPLTRTAEIMASSLFPTLMELYRCDESSSFKGLDGYYENSAAYQTYLRNVRNPYRSADGKKIGKNAITGTLRRGFEPKVR